MKSVIIVGAGIFGVTAALELHKRGYEVAVFDAGEIPHPEAATTDISKMVRMDYGTDELYMDLMTEAFVGWKQWNAEWGEDLYHEDGFLLMKKTEMTDGTFELESFKRLTERKQPVERMNVEQLAANHPMWNASVYSDGYVNNQGGWAESGRVVEKLTQNLRSLGVAIHENKPLDHLLEKESRVIGIVTTDGEKHKADVVVMAAGSWVPVLLPYLQDVMWATGHPVMHFKPENPDDFRPPAFRPWAADISNTGWYGFPLHPTGVVKIANHGKGVMIDPREPRVLPEGTEDRFREFLAETFPALADAPVAATRLCPYCDTWDGNLWIDHDPGRPGLVVATGGSGHGFKFAPMLGMIIADVMERKPNRYAERFAWRERSDTVTEDARFSG